MIQIQIDPRTLKRAEERGATREEIEDVIRTGTPEQAGRNQLSKSKIIKFRRIWRGEYYEQKKVQVIYIEEQEVATTVTVYVFYGHWGT